MRLACLSWPVEPLQDVATYAARLSHWAGEAKAGGADLLLLPEYAGLEIAPSGDAAAELRAAVARAPALLSAMRDVSVRHGLWLCPGTLPMAGEGGAQVVNRAPVIRPDGTVAFQDKRMPTRFEAERWSLAPGRPPQVFDTPWGRLGIAICYDAEFPKLVRAQVEAGAWLVLVPACTDTRHGAERVRIGARARAMENQCFVAVASTVGACAGSAALDDNHGRAGIYGPVDHGFPEDGILAESRLDAPGLILADLDPARLATAREHGAVRNHRDWPRAPVPPPEPAAWA